MGNLFPEYVSIQHAGFKMLGAILMFLTSFAFAYFLSPGSWIKIAIIFSFISFLMLVIMRLIGDEWAWTWLKEWHDKNRMPYLVGYTIKDGKLTSYVSKNRSWLINKCDQGAVILPLKGSFGELITKEYRTSYAVKNVSSRDRIPHIVIIQGPGPWGRHTIDFRISLPLDLALRKIDMLDWGLQDFLNLLPQSTSQREIELVEGIEKSISLINSASRKTPTMLKVRKDLEAILKQRSLRLLEAPHGIIWQPPTDNF